MKGSWRNALQQRAQLWIP